MNRLLLTILACSFTFFGQTTNYPAAVDNDRSLFVVADNIQATLSTAMGAGDVTATVGNATGFTANMVGTICDTTTSSGKCTAFEHMLVTAVNGNVLTVTRGFAGTSARTHAAGKLVSVLIDAAHQQSLKAGLIAIETAIGANLSRIAAYPLFNVNNYNFAAQSPGGTLAIGSNVAILSPIPAGIAVGNKLWVAGTGTPEAAAVTGWNSSTGQVIFTCAGTHSAGWTIASASFGMQEATVAAGAAGGGTVFIPAGTYTLRAAVNVSYSNIIFQGAGGMCCSGGTSIHRTGDFGDSIALGSTSLQINAIGIYDLSLSQDINYISGNPGTISNKPTSGAHIRAWGTNTLNIARVRLENMVQNLVLTGATVTVVRDSQFYGLWNGASVSTQVTAASILVNQAASGAGTAIPTYIALVNNVLTGSLSTSTPYAGASSRRNIEIDACEDCYIDGGSMERGYENNVLLSATAPYPLLNVRVGNVKFDSAGTCDVQLQGDGSQGMANVSIIGNTFNGELAGPTGLCVPTASPGSFPVQGATVTNNNFFAYLSTPVSIMDGQGYTISDNNIRYYNAANGFSTAAAASGIYFGDRANRAYGTGNIIGGGQYYEDYGTGTSHGKYGISMASPTGNQSTINVGWAPPTPASVQNYTPTVAGSCGTSPSVNALSTSNVGAFTTGTGSPSSCTVTFLVPFTHTPICSVANVAGAATPAVSSSSTTLVVTTSTASATYTWSCQ